MCAFPSLDLHVLNSLDTNRIPYVCRSLVCHVYEGPVGILIVLVSVVFIDHIMTLNWLLVGYGQCIFVLIRPPGNCDIPGWGDIRKNSSQLILSTVACELAGPTRSSWPDMQGYSVDANIGHRFFKLKFDRDWIVTSWACSISKALHYFQSNSIIFVDLIWISSMSMDKNKVYMIRRGQFSFLAFLSLLIIAWLPPHCEYLCYSSDCGLFAE